MAITHDPHPGPMKPSQNPPAQTTADGSCDTADNLGHFPYASDDTYAGDGYGGM